MDRFRLVALMLEEMRQQALTPQVMMEILLYHQHCQQLPLALLK